MIINCLTLFPEMFEDFLATGLAQKAAAKGLVDIRLIDIRDWSQDRHHRTDDYPFGGGPGMLMSAQPLFDCFDHLKAKEKGRTRRIYMSPAGRLFTQEDAERLAREYDTIDILCGHYEGVDQRVLDTYIDEEISIGDYVLTGGELPAMVIMDTAMRLLPGFVGNDQSLRSESLSDGLLEYPQYTRPRDFRGQMVPEVLLGGNHAQIERWQREQSIAKTFRNRPELLDERKLSNRDLELIKKLKESET